ncbi:hypothetical protein [Streptomyces sp. NPDC002402]
MSTLIPVPIPDRVAALIGGNIPIDVMQAEVDAVAEAREIGRLRPLASDEDRADRELAIGRLAAANKILAAYSPRLILTPKRGAA